jgi:geranylgeranyl diphosphate synthase type II
MSSGLSKQRLPKFETYFAASLSAIQQALYHYLAQDEKRSTSKNRINSGVEQFWQAMRYSLDAGGKRFRPILTVETALACGGKLEQVLPTACAIELIHTYSLIHDDLPCMDDDDLRRGQPTLHKAFDEATAVLVGDALSAMAFGWMIHQTPKEAEAEGVAAQTLLQLVGEFSDVCSVQGLVNGQYVDMFYEQKPYTADVLDYIHTYKRAALIRFSVRAGALLAGATGPLLEKN